MYHSNAERHGSGDGFEILLYKTFYRIFRELFWHRCRFPLRACTHFLPPPPHLLHILIIIIVINQQMSVIAMFKIRE